MLRQRFLAAVVAGILVNATGAARGSDLPAMVTFAPGLGDVRVGAAAIYFDEGEAALVGKAAALLASDLGEVTGKAGSMTHDPAMARVLIGTVGKSKAIDELIASGKVDARELAGKWETFVVQTVGDQVVIVGSDRRGTAYGVVELSEQMGVSPWKFFADVPSWKHEVVAVKAGTYKSKTPRVKYRGIFINDEDWGLRVWAGKTWDPALGNIGPKTYEKIFELMLRLKGNYLWPAMHPCSTEFGSIPENVKLADEWGIVMGASHCEPANRNNVWWDVKERGPWRYDTNRDGMMKYWEEWFQQRGAYEAVWTVGMRGIHDSGMQGPKDLPTQVKLLDQAITDQRALIAKYVNSEVTKVPQVFTPYKEALAHYRGGLKVPDDVTILWPDDNYGYVRQLSDPNEQKRSGGSGVYYHASYLGAPTSYLWFDSTPPAFIAEEMNRALSFGADRIWVLNVGDIKNTERAMEFWLRFGWDPQRWGEDPQGGFLREWATRDFGSEVAAKIVGPMNEFYRLCFQRKPETMEAGVFSATHYSEVSQRAREGMALQAEELEVEAKVSPERKDSFFELVGYPLGNAALEAMAFSCAQLSDHRAKQDRPDARDLVKTAVEVVADIHRLTERYNTGIAGGKWSGIVKEKGTTWKSVEWPKDVAATAGAPGVHVVVEGRSTAIGETRSPEPGLVDITAATHAAEWNVVNLGGRNGLIVPNGSGSAETLTPGAGPTVSFPVEVDAGGKLNLYLLTWCPSDKDDSCFVKIDDGAWVAWNNLPELGESWVWRRQGTHELNAGKHTVTLAEREDGFGVAAVRFSTKDSAQTILEQVPDHDADVLPRIECGGRELPRRFTLFTGDGSTAAYELFPSEPWIRTSTNGSFSGSVDVGVSADASKIPEGQTVHGTVTVKSGGKDVATVKVSAMNRAKEGTPFVERDGAVAMDAGHFIRAIADGDVRWVAPPHLGRTGHAVTALPANAQPRDFKAAPVVLEYDFEAETAGPASVQVYCLPTHHAHAGRGLRYAISVNDSPPVMTDFDEEGGANGESGRKWAQNVLRNTTVNVSNVVIPKVGKNTLKLWMVDPGVVVDKLVVDLGGVKSSELGPPETAR